MELCCQIKSEENMKTKAFVLSDLISLIKLVYVASEGRVFLLQERGRLEPFSVNWD
jgi:hypothetical protein